MRKPPWIPILLSLVLVSAGVGGMYLLAAHRRASLPPPSATPAAATPDAAAPVRSVNELATQPNAHLGAVQLTGVVATIEPGKQFVLIDQREYRACGIGCLGETGTKKITVRWSGKAPAIEQTVQVTGDLTHTAAGYAFTARKVGTR